MAKRLVYSLILSMVTGCMLSFAATNPSKSKDLTNFDWKQMITLMPVSANQDIEVHLYAAAEYDEAPQKGTKRVLSGLFSLDPPTADKTILLLDESGSVVVKEGQVVEISGELHGSYKFTNYKGEKVTAPVIIGKKVVVLTPVPTGTLFTSGARSFWALFNSMDRSDGCEAETARPPVAAHCSGAANLAGASAGPR